MGTVQEVQVKRACECLQIDKKGKYQADSNCTICKGTGSVEEWISIGNFVEELMSQGLRSEFEYLEKSIDRKIDGLDPMES